MCKSHTQIHPDRAHPSPASGDVAALSVNLVKIMYLCCEMTSHNEIVIFHSMWLAICDKDEFRSVHSFGEAAGPGGHV